MSLLLQDLANIFGFIFSFWWIWAPLLAFYLLKTVWVLYLATKYYSTLKWVLLEVKIPSELTKGPKAMEQIFAGLHGVFLPLTRKDKYIKGKLTQDIFSFEIVGNGGSMNFYVRALEGYRNLVESNIYAQFPDAEIMLADDYFKDLPQILPNDKITLWGNEFILIKEDAYPIRTYPLFEDPAAIEKEEKRVDPVASLAETITSLNPNEKLVLQFLIRPRGNDWAEEAKKLADKLFGKKPKEEATGFQKFTDYINSTIGAAPSKEDKKDETPSLLKLTPGEQDVLMAIERKTAKVGFDTGIRFLYIGPQEGFNRSVISAVVGFFRQFSVQNSNGFKMNSENFTYIKSRFFHALRDFRRKLTIYQKARHRSLTMKSLVVNIEELATLIHLPSLAVKAPGLEKIEAKKGQPPAALPTQ